MPVRLVRVAWIIILVGAWAVLACKAPQMLAGSIGAEPIVAASTPTATRAAATAPAYPGATQSIPYPGAGAGEVTATPIMAQPTSAYPAPGDLSPTSGGDQLSASPTASLDGALPTETSPDAYPGPTATPVFAMTPTPTQAGATTYPGPDGGETPTATRVFVGTPSPTPDFISTATPTSVFVPTPTGTLPAPVLPTFAPTPTPMPTPTAAPTPVPPPPWVSANLRASDPASVELASGRVQLIWFFAFWDGPSQAMAPLVHGLEDQYATRMNFIYLDIDDPRNEVFEEALGYRTQPHFFLLDAYGRTLGQWQGYVSVAEFQQAFEAALP